MEAIREVVVKVSIEAGEYNAQSFKDIALQIQRELQEAGSVHVRGGGGGDGSISPAGEPRYQYTPPGGPPIPTQYTPPGPTSYQPGGYQYSGVSGGMGMPGYGQSVRDRGAAFGSELTGIMREQSGGAGLNDSHWQKLEQKLSRQAEVRIREQDREAANAEKAYDREANAAVKSYGRIMAERRKLSEQTTLSLQNEIRLQEKADEKAEKIATREGQARQQQIYGGFSDVNRGVGSTISGGAALYSATGGPDSERMMQLMMAGHGVSSLYRGGSGIVGGAAALAGLGAGAAGVAGIAGGAVLAAGGADIAWSHLKMNESTARLHRQYEEMNRSNSAEFTRISNVGSLHGRMDYARATRVNPLAASRDADRTRTAMGELREQNEYESSSLEGFGNRVQTLGQHEEEVGRHRQTLGYIQGQRGFGDKLKDLDERKGFLKSGQAKLEAEPDRIRSQAEKQREAIDLQIRQIKSSPESRDFWGKKVHSQKQAEDINSLSKEWKGTFGTEGQAIAKNAEEVLRNKEKQAQVEQEILQTLAQQNKSIEQYKGEALEVVKMSSERTKQHRMGLGSSSIGDMWYRKELDEKHKRIESQRAKNRSAGANEDANIEEYTQEELAYLQNTNDVARKSAEAQALKQGQSLGIGGYFDEDERKAKKEYEDRVEATAGKSDQIAGAAKDSEGKVIETSNKARESLQTLEHVEETLEMIVEAMRKLDAKLDNSRAGLKEFT